MNTARSKDGTILAYDIHGTGPALVYITGASCFRKFGPIQDDVKIFAREFTVYNYDRRGRGDSGDTAPYAIEREIEDLEAMIDAAGGRAILYGHSSGAVLALEACIRLDKKIDGAVLYDPSYVHDEGEKIAYENLGRRIHDLLTAGKNAKAMRVFLKGIGMPGVFVLLLPLFPGWKTMKALAPTLEYDIALTRDPPPLERVREVRKAPLIIVGEKSPESIRRVGEQLSRAIPGARCMSLAGQDHMVSAKVLLPVLKDFARQGRL